MIRNCDGHRDRARHRQQQHQRSVAGFRFVCYVYADVRPREDALEAGALFYIRNLQAGGRRYLRRTYRVTAWNDHTDNRRLATRQLPWKDTFDPQLLLRGKTNTLPHPHQQGESNEWKMP